jgi:hypothetical protein
MCYSVVAVWFAMVQDIKIKLQLPKMCLSNSETIKACLGAQETGSTAESHTIRCVFIEQERGEGCTSDNVNVVTVVARDTVSSFYGNTDLIL